MSFLLVELAPSAVIVVLGIIGAAVVIKRGIQRVHDAMGQERRRLVWRIGLAVALVAEITLTVPPVASFLVHGELVGFVVDAIQIGVIALPVALALGFVTMLVIARRQGIALFGMRQA